MHRSLIVSSCLLALLAAQGARAAEARAGLTAEQIVEKNARARGGLKAWQAVRTLTFSGEMDAGGQTDPALPFVLSLKRPNKSRLEITFAGKNAVQAWDGAQGWKVRPFLNRDDVQAYTAAERASALATAELDGDLIDYERKGTRITRVRKDKVEGHKAYRLDLQLKGGGRRSVWVDATTFLETKVSGEPRKLDGRMHEVAIYCRDYRTVNGLKLPFVLETAVEGVKKTHKMTIAKVTVNPPLDDAMFAKPKTTVARATAGNPRAP